MADEPKTAADAFEELHQAMLAFGWAVAESLRAPQVVEWLARQLHRVTSKHR